MNSVARQCATRLALAMSLLWAVPTVVRAQDPKASPSPVDQQARKRAELEAKKAADLEERELRLAAEKERKEAEAETKKRARVAPSKHAPSKEAPSKDASGKVQPVPSKDVERRRRDEDRAEREAAKAREAEDKTAKGDRKSGRPTTARPKTGEAKVTEESAEPVIPVTKISKEEEKRRKDLVRQIEKARAERDRLNSAAEEAEGVARAARNTASEGQRAYEALTTGLDVEDVSLAVAPDENQPKKSRFFTKADEKLAAMAMNGGQAADPLRLALDLKKPDPEDRERAAFALASIGPEALPATRALMATLADANPSVRVAAAQALGRIGPGASMAIAPLSAALTDPDPAVKNAAQAALIAIQGR